MGKLKRRKETGHINAVQEYRFDFITDDGRGLLLTLNRYAAVGLDGLCALHAANAHVEVEYAGEPDLTTAIAYSLKEV